MGAAATAAPMETGPDPGVKDQVHEGAGAGADVGVCGVSEMGRLGAEMGPGVGLLGNFRPGRARAFEALRWAASSSSSTSSKHFMKPWRGGERLWAPIAITGPLCSLVFLTCGDSRGHQGGLWLSRSPPLKLLLVPRLWGNLKLLPVATPEGCAPNLPCLLLAPALGSSPTNAYDQSPRSPVG